MVTIALILLAVLLGAALVLAAALWLQLRRLRRDFDGARRNYRVLLSLAELDPFVWDADGEFETSPRKTADWPREQGKAVSPKKVLSADDWNEFQCRRSRLLSGEAPYFSLDFRMNRGPGGRAFTMQAVPEAGNGGETRYLGVLREMSATGSASGPAGDFEPVLTALLAALPMAAAVKDPGNDFRYIAVNRLYTERFELAAPPESDTEIFTSSAEFAVVRAADRSALAAAEGGGGSAESYTFPDGRVVRLRGGRRLFRTPDGASRLLVLYPEPERSPLSDPAVAAKGTASHAAPEPEGSLASVPAGISVMAVDDVPMNLRVLELQLREIGITRIRLCNSAREVLEALKQERPDVLLADLWMPEMTGDELAAQLAANPATAGIPVIAVTADQQARNLKVFRDILFKPISTATLRRALLNCPPPRA